MRFSRALFGVTVLFAAALPATGEAQNLATSAQSAISAYRKQHGLSAVTVDPQLMAAAQQQANAMARAGVLDHNVAGPLSRRIPHSAGAENIAAGTRDFPTTLTMWKRSSGHNANLLNRGMTRIGIASARSSNARYGTYWALILAGSPAQPRIGQPTRMRGAAAKSRPERAAAPWFVNWQLGLQ